MDKYFICLANSYKHGGRCIAGIEVSPSQDGRMDIVRHDDGRPCWIRPVSMAENGEIPMQLAQDVKLLSLVRLTDVAPSLKRLTLRMCIVRAWNAVPMTMSSKTIS